MAYIFERLGDLTDAQSVHLYCNRCSRHGELDLMQMLRMYGTRCKFTTLRAKLYCKACGTRDVEWRWGHDGRPGDREKRLVEILWPTTKDET